MLSSISGEQHRYQLVKIASTTQLEAHAYVIEGERQSNGVSVVKRSETPPPARLSGY